MFPVGKRLDKKAKFNFKVYYATMVANNYKAHIAQYLKKERQSDSEIGSDNRTYREKYFSGFRPFFFGKVSYEIKASG